MHIGFSIAAYSGRSRAAIRRHMPATMLDALPADPWMRSTLLGLALHRRRQLWVARVLKSELGVDLAMLAVDEVLAGPLTGMTSAALAVICAREHPKDEIRVRTLLARLDPRGPIPEPHLWERCEAWVGRLGRH